ncbi:hypothetical protein [Ottowia massiliensis]|uniref:hypothetical protein n=1 Tax=Ottowia massiliensis TaxID=2045302 RepID=UPI0013041EC4|nr:hypothetical protein [Ottowia massiliensis]
MGIALYLRRDIAIDQEAKKANKFCFVCSAHLPRRQPSSAKTNRLREAVGMQARAL